MTNRTRFKNIFILLPLFLILATLTSSCASWLPDAHRQDVIQGNEIKKKTLKKIHIGMKKSEITPLIGNPTLKDPFHANRWDYIYRLVPGRQQAKQSRLTLFFKGDELIKMDDSEYKELESLIEKEK
ncbi:MAG: outer membrane protein assembly factor BamE [Gammaproteobacteria bacterium]